MAQTATTDTPPPIQATVAGAVRAELARRRKSGRDLASALGWSERTMRRRLAGDIAFSVDELAAVAKHLDVPLVDLLPT